MSEFYKSNKSISRYCARTIGITNSPQFTSRLKQFLTRRNDKIYISTQSVTVLLYLAVNGDETKCPIIEKLRIKYMKYMLTNGTDQFTSVWKAATVALSNLLSDNILEEAKTRKDLNADEVDIYDDLLELYGHLSPSEIPNEEEFYFFSYIQQARFLPLPSMKATGMKVIEYIQGLVKDRSTKYDDNAFQVGQILSDQVRVFAKKTGKKLFRGTHLSLSSGSCWEASREQLGKWHLMLPSSELTEFLETPCGNLFDEVDNEIRDMYGNTICQAEFASYPIWSVAYLEEPLPGDFGEVYTIHEDLGTQFDRGFDARLGLLFFLWASLKKKDKDDSATEELLQAKLIIIGEPGAKIRPLTSGETWAYLYMIPAMHMLKEAIECLPGARVGLTEHDNLWRFGTSYANHFAERKDQDIPEFISSSDLASATDNFGHKLAQQELKGFIQSSDASSGTINYLTEAVEMCCSPRKIHYKTTNRLARKIKNSIPEISYAEGSKRELIFTSQCGVMMGDPITKVLLTMTSMASWFCTQAGFNHLKDVSFSTYVQRKYNTGSRNYFTKTPGSAFACAGDDHTAVGTLKDVIRPPKFLQSMNLEISWDKYIISRKYVSYCQAFGFAPKWKRSIQADTIKVRLTNEFRKQGGHDSFEEPDPLIGKARDLERSIRHFSSDKYKVFMQGVIPVAMRAGMPRWFETKIYRKDQTYLPSAYGGLGIPSRVDWTRSDKACNIYKTYCLGHVPGLLKPRIREKAWHRGVEFQEQLTELKSTLGGKTFYEAWTEVQSSLDSGSATSSGAKRIQKNVYTEFIRIDEPCTLLGTKESTPAEVYSSRALSAAVRPDRRARQILIQKARYYHGNKSIVDSIPYEQIDMTDLHLKRPGIWIERQTLHERLRITFSAPKLGFTTRLFDGKVGNFAAVEELPYDGRPLSSEFEFEFEPEFESDFQRPDIRAESV